MSSEVIRIDANARSVSQLLKERKYQIDYYQREYRWETKHVEELLTDLTEKFFNYYDEQHDRSKDGSKYGHYFLGPIILSQKNGNSFIVDGQQRLTTLTLLLIYLKNLEEKLQVRNPVKLDDHIFSEVRGLRSFNIDNADRSSVMEALYLNKSFDPSGKSETVQNIYARYQDLVNLFSDELKTEHALLMFIDWLLYNVDLVEIVAYSDEDAYTVFETMNDRGLNLSPTDMLKGYLLANIEDDKMKEQANSIWKKRILELVELGRKAEVRNEEVEACKTWLRARYAEKIRERKRGATNQDFEQIGTAFHRWVRENNNRLGLNTSQDFFDFIHDDFDRYMRFYQQMREKSFWFDPQNEHLYYNYHNNLTLQYILALAPIRRSDPEEIAWRKIRAVAVFLDIWAARRMVNYRTLSYSSIVYTMFNIAKEIRDLDLPDLIAVLKEELTRMTESFDAIRDFRLHGMNKRQIHYLLARMTYFIERESGKDSNFPAYVNRSEKKKAVRFEVEHIMANKFDIYRESFENEEAFQRGRNSLGGLLLLNRGPNQSLGDLHYVKKYKHYLKENFLAASLHPDFYNHNSNFQHFIQRYELPFKPYERFDRKSLEERQELYIQLANLIWNPDILDTV
jgi:uncharacterized protein with ParB-like and HNH nuclease domain